MSPSTRISNSILKLGSKPFLPRDQALPAMRLQKATSDMLFRQLLAFEQDQTSRPPKRFVPYDGDGGADAKIMEELVKGGSMTAEMIFQSVYKCLADDAFKEGRYKDALKYYSLAIGTAHPHNRDCYSNKCLTLIKLERYTEAMAAYTWALITQQYIHGANGWDVSFEAKSNYRAGLALKGLGLYEKAIFQLRRAAWLAPGNTSVAALTKEVTDILIDLDKTYAGQRHTKQELDGRMMRDGQFGLTKEEIDMLCAAGAMPWDYGVDEIIAAGKGCADEDNGWATSVEESDDEDELAARMAVTRIGEQDRAGPSTTDSEQPLRHQLLICQNCYKSKADGLKLLKCLRCGIATYCGRECQKAHWPDHKIQCAINAPEKDKTMDSESLFHQLRTWVSRHRPTFSDNLSYGLNLAHDPTAYKRKVMIYTLDYQPDVKRSAEKFKVKVADSVSMASLMGVTGLDPFHDIREQRELREAEIKTRMSDAVGVAMYVLMAVHKGETAFNVVPVAFDQPMADDMPPVGWKERMIQTLNSGTVR